MDIIGLFMSIDILKKNLNPFRREKTPWVWKGQIMVETFGYLMISNNIFDGNNNSSSKGT